MFVFEEDSKIFLYAQNYNKFINKTSKKFLSSTKKVNCIMISLSTSSKIIIVYVLFMMPFIFLISMISFHSPK